MLRADSTRELLSSAEIDTSSFWQVRLQNVDMSRACDKVLEPWRYSVKQKGSITNNINIKASYLIWTDLDDRGKVIMIEGWD